MMRLLLVLLPLLTIAAGSAEARLPSVECSSLLQASRHLARQVPIQDGQTNATTAASSAPPQPKVFLGIKTAPGNVERRRAWRESRCGQGLLAAGIQYAFVVGVPTSKGHNLSAKRQGQHASEDEQRQAKKLLSESEEFKDMLIVPLRDLYQDLSNKLLVLLEHGYRHVGAEYVAEADDDYCVQPQPLLAAIAEHEDEQDSTELWAGAEWAHGTEYQNMRGPHNEEAPFFSGHGSVLSRGLVKLIVADDAAHSVLSALYGTSSDDANVGKWVQYARSVHGVRVDVRLISGMLGRQLSK